ncbi:MAG: H/ACA ribonucleoprotein complex subunit GAR1 [Halobacteriaceae archaeon]
MQRAGEVVRATGGIAVVRAEGGTPPAIGTETVDKRLEGTGRIVDVFGPVERPYLAVSPPEGRSPASLIGQRLYVRQ